MVTFHIRKTISNNDLLIQNADTHAYLFQRFFVSVDDCFLERCARSGRDGMKNIRVQCLSVLVECFLRHEDVQPLLGLCQPDTVYLEHPVKGDRRVGFDLRARVSNVVDGNFHVRKVHVSNSSLSYFVNGIALHQMPRKLAQA